MEWSRVHFVIIQQWAVGAALHRQEAGENEGVCGMGLTGQSGREVRSMGSHTREGREQHGLHMLTLMGGKGAARAHGPRREARAEKCWILHWIYDSPCAETLITLTSICL